MSRAHRLSIASTIAAVLVAVLSIVSFRSDDEYTRTHELFLLALPSVIVLVLVLAYVVFRCIVPLAELLERPDLFGLGMSALSLLLLLLPFWFVVYDTVYSIDWGLFSGMSIVLGMGAATVGEISVTRSNKPGWPQVEDISGSESKWSESAIWSYLAIVIGILVVVANFAAFVLDVFVV